MHGIDKSGSNPGGSSGGNPGSGSGSGSGNNPEIDKYARIQAFVDELEQFAEVAEKTLVQIETDLEKNRGLFSVFEKKMFAIRGTAIQLDLESISNIAGLGEEISIKAEKSSSKAQARRCVSCLWDVVTTVKYLLEHHSSETTEEQNILINRLKNTLRILGGQRPKMTAQEIEEALKKRG